MIHSQVITSFYILHCKFTLFRIVTFLVLLSLPFLVCSYNYYTNMVSTISLNCRLFQNIEEIYDFTIVVNTENSVEKFKKEIKEKIKEGGIDIFADIEADHLILWWVSFHNSDKYDFSNVNLPTVSE